MRNLDVCCGDCSDNDKSISYCFECCAIPVTLLEQIEYDRNEKSDSILDKLRAEIENINPWAMRYEPDKYLDQRPQIVQKVKEHVIEIIDKYKAESEVEHDS